MSHHNLFLDNTLPAKPVGRVFYYDFEMQVDWEVQYVQVF